MLIFPQQHTRLLLALVVLASQRLVTGKVFRVYLAASQVTMVSAALVVLAPEAQ